jgi:hypothetical protein
MTPATFVARLAAMQLPSVFNPYSDRCAVHDCEDAAHRRQRNLRLLIEAALEARTETMWIARDLGYRGGRRTGIPLTDEAHLLDASKLFGGIPLVRATQGPIVAERTASVIWRLLTQIGTPIVLWNVFPLHPHDHRDQLSNRCHTRLEREAAWPLLQSLVAMVRPSLIVAIGKDAQASLFDLGLATQAVRHPSYGGQSDFIAGVRALYGIKDNVDVGADEAEAPLFDNYVALGGRHAVA